MRKFLIGILLFPCISFGQRLDIDVFGGMSNYQGDLQVHFLTFESANPAAALMLKWGITDKLYVRTGFAMASLSADDKTNIQRNQSRNLRFRTGLQEYTLGVEYRIFNLDNIPVTPYVFAGLGAFHYNPYTYYTVNGKLEQVYLQPLGTEGQGISGYPAPYKLFQFCIPYGVGIKYKINCNLNVGLELRQTKTFTDYIDDVSSTYADEAALLAANGQLAVDLAYRGDEYNGKPYPKKGTQRGNPNQGDLYYFAGVTIGLRLNDCESGQFSLGGIFNRGGSSFKGGKSSKNILRQVSCPKN